MIAPINRFIMVILILLCQRWNRALVSGFTGGLSRKRRPPLVASRSYSSGTIRSDDSNLITNTKSATVKKIQSLLNKPKKRLELRQTVLEGPRLVFDLLDHVATRPAIRQVIVSEDRPDYLKTLSAMISREDDIFVQIASAAVMNACTDTVTHQGILAVVDIPTAHEGTSPIPDEQRRVPLYLVSDGVSDPGNMGTLIRSAVATGIVTALYLLPGSCDAWSPKAVRSAAGATFFDLPIRVVSSWEECREDLQDRHADLRWVAATMAEERGTQSASKNMSHHAWEWAITPTALVLGNEGQGLSPVVREAVADGKVQAVHVPMCAPLESLNAAVCGSVILFEAQRQFQQQQQKKE